MNSASAPERILAYVMESAPESITAQEHKRAPGKDLTDAMLKLADLRGADLHSVKGLEQDRLDTACSDETTRLPKGLRPRPCVE